MSLNMAEDPEMFKIRKKRIIDDLLLDPSSEPIVNVLRIKRYLELLFEENGLGYSTKTLNKYSTCPNQQYMDQWSIELLRLRLGVFNSIIGDLSAEKLIPKTKSKKGKKQSMARNILPEKEKLNNDFEDCLSLFSKKEFKSCGEKLGKLINDLKDLEEPPYSIVQPPDLRGYNTFLKKSIGQDVKLSNKKEFEEMFSEQEISTPLNHDIPQKTTVVNDQDEYSNNNFALQQERDSFEERERASQVHNMVNLSNHEYQRNIETQGYDPSFYAQDLNGTNTYAYSNTSNGIRYANLGYENTQPHQLKYQHQSYRPLSRSAYKIYNDGIQR